MRRTLLWAKSFWCFVCFVFCVLCVVCYDAFRLVDDTPPKTASTPTVESKGASMPRRDLMLNVGLYRICGSLCLDVRKKTTIHTWSAASRSVFGQTLHKRRRLVFRIPSHNDDDDVYPQLQLPRNAYRQIVLPFRQTRNRFGVWRAIHFFFVDAPFDSVRFLFVKWFLRSFNCR